MTTETETADDAPTTTTVWIVPRLYGQSREAWVYHTRADCGALKEGHRSVATTRDGLNPERTWRECRHCAGDVVYGQAARSRREWAATPPAAMRERYDRVVVSSQTRCIHPTDADGEPLCAGARQIANPQTWSLAAYPDDDRICKRCRETDALHHGGEQA